MRIIFAPQYVGIEGQNHKKTPNWAYILDYEKEVKQHEFFKEIYEEYRESLRKELVDMLNISKSPLVISTSGTQMDAYTSCFLFCRDRININILDLSEFEKFVLFIHQKEFIIPSYTSVIA